MRLISSLPTELHDLIKSFLPVTDQVRFFHCRRGKFGSRVFEGAEQVEEAFFTAIERNKPNVVEHILKCYPSFDPSFDDNFAILYASEKGNVKVVKTLLANPRVDPSADNNVAIRFASFYGHSQVVKILLADPKVNSSVYNNETIDDAPSRKNSRKKSFVCKVCGKTLSSSPKDHARTHTGETPFKCDVCEKSFARLFNLKVHKRTHSGEKPFKCKDCDQSFTTAGNLKRHDEKWHAGVKPFQCNLCGKSFAQSSQLKSHKVCIKNQNHSSAETESAESTDPSSSNQSNPSY